MSYKPQWYRSPLDLPERVSGKVRVKHRVIQAGDEVPIVGMRQGLLRGVRPVMGVVQAPLRIHELSHEDHGVWMTDMPEELNQIGEMLHCKKWIMSPWFGCQCSSLSTEMKDELMDMARDAMRYRAIRKQSIGIHPTKQASPMEQSSLDGLADVLILVQRDAEDLVKGRQDSEPTGLINPRRT